MPLSRSLPSTRTWRLLPTRNPISKRAHSHLVDVASDSFPQLAKALHACGPIPLRRSRRAYGLADALCRAVAGQQLSVQAAATIWQRLQRQVGAEQLSDYALRVRPLTLQRCGLSRAKAKAIRAISRAVRAGMLDERALQPLSADERRAELTQIWGVGPWTADMLNIFYFGDPDVWPDGDLTARSTLKKLTSPRRKTERTAALFAPYRSYLAVHMWHHAHQTPA